MNSHAVLQPQDRAEANPSAVADPPLSDQEVVALRQACAPLGLLNFPPVEVIRNLRRLGYVEIVLGGIQITPNGLERLLRERKRKHERATS